MKSLKKEPKKDIEKEQDIVCRIIALIKPKYLEKAALTLRQNKGEKDSMIITIENNPWRNGVIKGDMLFGRIKTGKNKQYVQINYSFSRTLRKMNIPYTANRTELKESKIRIELSDFCDLLESPTDNFVELLNNIFLRCISFNEFGCCSKYAECEQQGKCLHIDQLYATACQWQKHLKRTGKIGNT